MGEKDRKTLKELLDSGILYLTGKGIEEAATDAWLLLEEVFQISRSWYFAHSDTEAEEQKARRYESLLEQRGQRIPLQHLTGKTWFYGLPFTVNEHVLIPRQDTEILVEEALKYLKPGMRVLDPGYVYRVWVHPAVGAFQLSFCDGNRRGPVRKSVGDCAEKCG